MILFVKNVTREGPGRFAEVASALHIPYEIVDLSQGESLPPPHAYQAIVVLGGPDSANDETEKMLYLLDFVEMAVITLKKPYLGICLGMQVLARVAGGKVVKHTIPEIGARDSEGNFFSVSLTETGRYDPLFRGLPSAFRLFHLHGETVQLADEISLLGYGKACRNQVIRVGARAYGIQGHLELTSELFQQWLSEDPDLKCQNQERLTADFAFLEAQYRQTGQQIFKNFVQLSYV